MRAVLVSEAALRAKLAGHRAELPPGTVGQGMEGAGLPPVRLTRRVGWLGRCCGVGECLVFDRCEPSESALPAAAVIRALDPGDDRQAELLTVRPAPPIEHVLLQESEEGLHRGVVSARADPAHRADQAVVYQRADEGVRAEL